VFDDREEFDDINYETWYITGTSPGCDLKLQDLIIFLILFFFLVQLTTIPKLPQSMAAGGNNFKGWIWPSDRCPGQSWKRNRWSSFKDVLMGKGADIYVGSLDKDPHQPSRPRWSNWGRVFHDIPPHEREALNPFGLADRSHQVYDFRTRRYRCFSDGPQGMWSDVRRCPNKYARAPTAYRDAYGIPHDLRFMHFDPFFGDETCWSKHHV
jgi:hypothetical protein